MTQAELKATVERISDDPSTTGVLVQLPLPAQLCEEALAESFQPLKDVDAFHPLNMGRLLMRNRSASMVPCTALVRGRATVMSSARVTKELTRAHAATQHEQPHEPVTSTRRVRRRRAVWSCCDARGCR